MEEVLILQTNKQNCYPEHQGKEPPVIYLKTPEKALIPQAKLIGINK